MKRALLIFSLILATGLAGCSDSGTDGGDNSGGSDTGGPTGGSAAIVFNLIA